VNDTIKQLSAKPKLRPLADGCILATFACGTTATIRPEPSRYGSGTAYSVDEIIYAQQYATLEQALRAAALELGKLRLAPLTIDLAALREMATSVERDQCGEACKILRRLLRERTGRDWSVTHSLGTAWSWMQIHAVPKRRGAFGYLTIEDQILLSAALGTHVHTRGESMRPSSGSRGIYVFRAAGVPVPEDWRISEATWD